MRGVHAVNFVDRTGETYGHFTPLAFVRTDHRRRAVWSCRCDCGRPDCAGTAERTSFQLVRDKAGDCRHRNWNDHALKPRPRPAATAAAPPEGLRHPWSRSAASRAERDARLLRAFSEADLR